MKTLLIFTIIVLSLVSFSCGTKYSIDKRYTFLANLENGIHGFIGNMLGNEMDAQRTHYKLFEDMASKNVNEIRNLPVPNLEVAASLKTQTINMIDSAFKYDLKSPYIPKESVNAYEEISFAEERPVMKYIRKESRSILDQIKTQKARFGMTE